MKKYTIDFLLLIIVVLFQFSMSAQTIEYIDKNYKVYRIEDHTYGIYDENLKKWIVGKLNLEVEETGYYFRFGMCPVMLNGKWGYLNDKGIIMIPMIYESASPFNEMGIAPVVKNQKIGFIDLKGNEITKFEYDYKDALYFAWHYDTENYQGVFKNKNAGLIDKKGKEVISCSLGYQEVGFFAQISESEYEIIFFMDGYCAVKRNNKWGFVDINGKVVVECQYEDVKPIKNNIYAYSVNNKWGLKNLQGKVIIEPKYYDISDFTSFIYGAYYEEEGWAGYFNSNLCQIALEKNQEQVWGFINVKGVEVISPKFEIVEKFNKKGVALVSFMEEEFYINTKGEKVKNLVEEEKK